MMRVSSTGTGQVLVVVVGRYLGFIIIIIIIIIIIGVWVFFGSLAGSGGWLVEGGGWILTLTKASGGSR